MDRTELTDLLTDMHDAAVAALLEADAPTEAVYADDVQYWIVAGSKPGRGLTGLRVTGGGQDWEFARALPLWLAEYLCVFNPQAMRALAAALLEKAEARRAHRCRPCGCGWCCANTPTDKRGEAHQRVCQPHHAESR